MFTFHRAEDTLTSKNRPENIQLLVNFQNYYPESYGTDDLCEVGCDCCGVREIANCGKKWNLKNTKEDWRPVQFLIADVLKATFLTTCSQDTFKLVSLLSRDFWWLYFFNYFF